jgi:hypothetical protein
MNIITNQKLLRRYTILAQGGMLGGLAVLAGGPSGGCIPATLADTRIDYEELSSTGAIMGSGGLVVARLEENCLHRHQPPCVGARRRQRAGQNRGESGVRSSSIKMSFPSLSPNSILVSAMMIPLFSASSRIRSRSKLSSLGLPLYCLLDRFTLTSLHDFRSLSPKLSITYITAFLLPWA